MKQYYKNKIYWLISLFCIFILIILFNNYYYGINNYGVKEYFGTTSSTVNLPLNTTYSCKNFCSPTSRCAITGEQCFADIDCPGCQPVNKNKNNKSDNIPGENDAGLLTYLTPQYSTLTTDIGTQSKRINYDNKLKPLTPNFGINTWMTSFEKNTQEFNKRYKPNNIINMPSYENRYSLSGIFIDEGPLASNSYLN